MENAVQFQRSNMYQTDLFFFKFILLSWQLVNEILEKHDQNQQNETSSEVDEDVEVGVVEGDHVDDEDVEVEVAEGDQVDDEDVEVEVAEGDHVDDEDVEVEVAEGDQADDEDVEVVVAEGDQADDEDVEVDRKENVEAEVENDVELEVEDDVEVEEAEVHDVGVRCEGLRVDEVMRPQEEMQVSPLDQVEVVTVQLKRTLFT